MDAGKSNMYATHPIFFNISKGEQYIVIFPILANFSFPSLSKTHVLPL
jgi:hypothetical protein